MALVKNYLEGGSPCPRRGHVGWTYKQKAYFTGGYTEIFAQRFGMPTHQRRSKLLRDIHCLDLQNVSWMSESPFPEPSAYLDGHTASWFGTKLVLIAGGTYPDGHNPELSFSLTCSNYVYILETNPPCNPDGSIPALEWRKLRLVQETLEDLEGDMNEGYESDDVDEDIDDEQFDELSDDEFEDDFDDFVQDGAQPAQHQLIQELLDEMRQPQNPQAAAVEPQNPNNLPLAAPAADQHALPIQALQQAQGAPNNGNEARHILARALNAGQHLLAMLPGFGAPPPAGPVLEARNVNTARGTEDENCYLRPRVWHSSTVVGNRIYVIGGRDMHLRYFGDVCYFDMDTEKFVRVKLAPNSPKLPPRAAHGAVCPDNRHIYVFGGRFKYPAVHNGLTHRHYNDLWVFDTRYNSWKLLINPPEADPSKYMKQPIHPYLAPAQDDDANNETSRDSHDSSSPDHRDPSGKHVPSRDADDYPAPRCCFVMVLDPDLPHKAHIVGGYTSSNICFYYIGDAWTLDLLELSWKPMKFLPDSEHLNRISIHTPTYFYDQLLLFAGEGSVDVAEVPYGSQQFLPYMTTFTIPQTPFAEVLRYRDPVAFSYYQLSLRSDLADVKIETPDGAIFNLHRVVVAARMKRLHQLLVEAGSWTSAGPSLSFSGKHALASSSNSASGLRSSQRSTTATQICTISGDVWEQFIRSSLPEDFFSTFERKFDYDALTQAFLYAYTDGIHKIHRVPLDRLVQLYHLGMIMDLRRLSAYALEQIAERIDPYFPRISNASLLAELVATTLHFAPGVISKSKAMEGSILKLINVLQWHILNSTSAVSSTAHLSPVSNIPPARQNADEPTSQTDTSSTPLCVAGLGIASSQTKPLSITPSITLPRLTSCVSISPSRHIGDVALEWLQSGLSQFATLSVAMDALFIDLNASESIIEGDFELYVPAAAEEEQETKRDENGTEKASLPSAPSDTSANASNGEMTAISAFLPNVSPNAVPIVVHKNILAFSSPYLKGLLSNDFQETQQGYAVVSAPYPMERASLCALIQFMYGGSIKHIQDKNTALDILCNIPFFYSQRQELLKPLPHLGVQSTRLLRRRSLEIELMTHCIDVVLSGDVSDVEVLELQQLAIALGLVQFEQRLMKFSSKRAHMSVKPAEESLEE